MKVINSFKMKAISIILKNLKNLSPYFLLVGIYFFFVNLEARKENDNFLNPVNEDLVSDDMSSFNNKKLRIKIPVIPFDK